MHPMQMLRRLTAAPPHKTAAKVCRRLKQTAGNALRRRFDARHDTHSTSRDAMLTSYFGSCDIGELRAAVGEESCDALSHLCGDYLKHRFNLLGSGWVQVRHGMGCVGLNGHRYSSGEAVSVDRNGDWLVGRLNEANLARSQSTWRLVDADYVPINWQLDFKSGYRWSETTWYRDIPFAHLPGVDIKVPWELARMQHLPQMALASCLESDAHETHRLAREFRNQVLDFLATNPPRFGVNWQCAMDVGIRVANWLFARDLFIAGGAEFDDAFERELAGAVHDHAAHIVANLERTPQLTGNHYLADIAGLLFAAAYLPCSEPVDAWLSFAVRELIAEVETQFLADGGNFEASTCYHGLSAEMVIWCTSLVMSLGPDKRAALSRFEDSIHSAFPSWYFERLERMTEFVVHTTKPDGRLHQVGDNDSGRFLNVLPTDQLDPRSVVAAANGLFNTEKFEAFCGTHRVETAIVAATIDRGHPSETLETGTRLGLGASLRCDPSHPHCDSSDAQSQTAFTIQLPDDVMLTDAECIAYTDFGLYIWRTPRCYFAVRCGPIGQNGIGGHAHNDQLAIELQVEGQDWIADPGTFLYTPDPQARNAYRSVAAHCAPRLEDEREPGRLDRGLFQIDGCEGGECLHFGRDGFVGRHTGFGPAVIRTIRIEKSRILIEDSVEGDLQLTPVADITPASLPIPSIAFSSGYGVRVTAVPQP